MSCARITCRCSKDGDARTANFASPGDAVNVELEDAQVSLPFILAVADSGEPDGTAFVTK